jgi:D-alanyl-D-alanine dipeptidase
MIERGYVATKSGHSRGSTVDLTLYHLATGELVSMGGSHDLMDPISHHGAKGITQVEAENRDHLCSIMTECGFGSYPCEWWHYTLKREPYPNTYFDFPITWMGGRKKRLKRLKVSATSVESSCIS